MGRLFKAAILILLLPVNAPAFEGIKVTDGDTIRIDDRRIRLLGIDAPESKQECYLERRKWKCGYEARGKLYSLIQGKKLECKTQSKDRYQREVAICYADGVDVNREMVHQGYAVAYAKYSKLYVNDEAYAREHKLGIWAGTFETPEKWRKKKHK